MCFGGNFKSLLHVMTSFVVSHVDQLKKLSQGASLTSDGVLDAPLCSSTPCNSSKSDSYN
jgi:hypothetical protein